MQNFYQLSDLEKQQAGAHNAYLEFLRIPQMSAGIYVLPAGSTDRQIPHQQDELYYVVQGQARMKVGSEDQPVAPGSLIFVAAGVEHRFHDINKELTVLVFFAPAESD
ncbi:MAG: cupin domain-containing protein [Acidobacteriaceae bacterium]|nr:cupin domain-containing protein [Acidobacteriaceae bacterium]